MAFNPHILRTTRKKKDSAARKVHRKNQFNNAPFVSLSDLSNGSFRGRLWPSSEKNPHGYLDYRGHDIPTKYLTEGVDPGIHKVQCPRSTNWDPIPMGEDEDGQPIFKNRCLCCEINAWVDEPEYEMVYDNNPESETYGQEVEMPVEESEMIYDLPEHIQEIIGTMHYESSFSSSIFIPVSLMAYEESRVKEVGNNGKEYTNITYAPHPTQRLDCILKFKHSSKAWEQLRRAIEQDVTCNDLVTGRWFTITKQNDGKGQGGYDIAMDLTPSPAGFEPDWKIHTNFTTWGTGGKNRPSKRLSFEAQLSIVENAEWAPEFRNLGIPFTDAQAAQMMADQSEPGVDW